MLCVRLSRAWMHLRRRGRVLCLRARIVDHVHTERRTDAAARAVRAAAVLRERGRKCLLPLGLQESFEHTGRCMCPRQRLANRARATAEIFPVNAALLKRSEVAAVVKEIRPTVKLCTVLPRLIECRRKAAVAARKDPLDHGETRIVVVERNRAIGDVLLEELLPPLKLLNRQLSEPLERRIGLWHKAGDGDRHLAATTPTDLRIEIDHLFRKACNADDVLICLRRQPHHEVELHLLPPMTERCAARSQQILLRHALVDDIAHTLRPRFGCKGQPRFTHLLHPMREVNRKAVDAQ